MDDENQAAQATVETCPAPDCRTASAPAGLEEKLAALEEFFRSQGRVCVAASGGVDSSFLAAVGAHTTPSSEEPPQLGPTTGGPTKNGPF